MHIMRLPVRLFLTFACLALPWFVSAATPKKRVIISTDLGLGLVGGWRSGVDADDGWAVPMALHDPSLDVTLVATVLGNSNVAAEQIAADRLLRDVMHSNVKRVRGAAVKLDDPQAALNGEPLLKDCVNPAVDAMSAILKKGKATIIAIGPLTDVACVVLNNSPRTIANIEEVVAIMGRAPHEEFAIGAVTGLTDFNLVMDNRALSVLLNQSGVPMTFLQFSLTSQVLIPRDFVTKLKGGTTLQQYVYNGTIGWIDSWQKIFKEDGFHPWDSNAVWYTIEPSAFACEKVNYILQPCAKDVHDPYNRLGGCAGHSETQKVGLDKEAMQLWLGGGISASRTVNACTAYSSAQARARYEDAVRAFLSIAR
jgi:inosine-uridine nucleoside N-ribohydrolase